MKPVDSQDRGPGRGRFLARACAVACLGIIFWMGLGWDGLLDRANYVGKKGDYYNWQVHGFLSGHLYMDREADPRLASPDLSVRAQAPFLLDASLYRGRYYLYFGVTPAALIFLPYAWLTGSDLEPRIVVVLCTALGFLFSLGVLRMAARDFIGRTGAWFQAVAAAILAFATAAPLLLTRAMFYEVPIATGYVCTMAGAFWIYRAMFRTGSACLSLALASTSLGLAVGCRPDLVLAIPVLFAAPLIVAWWGREGTPWRRAAVRLCAAALVPAALIGACLAAYNYERFGNPLEFGMSYSLNSYIQDHNRLARMAFLWPNLHWYYLTFPALSPYFPYVYPEQAYFGPAGYIWGEAFHGQFPVFALAGFVAISALALRRRLRLGRLAAYLAILGWMFLALLAAMSSLGVRADRYMVDFQPPLALSIVLVAGAIASVLGGGIGPGLWRAAFSVFAASAVAFNFFAGIQEFESFKNIRVPTYRTLEALGNYPSYWLERVGVLRPGPIEMKVVFPENPPVAAVEPLLSVGTPDCTDSLYAIEWAGGTVIELLADHHGYGGPKSAFLPITPGQAYTFRIDMGAFYPPLRHPFFAPYKATQAHLLKGSIRVEMDGKVVLDRKMNSFDAPPWTLEIGSNDVTPSTNKTEFTGRILSERRLAPPDPQPVQDDTGLWRIQCVLPMQRPNDSFPLLSTGAAGSGTLVFLTVLPGGQIRFGIDEWGAGASFSDSFKPKALPEHVVEIYIGSLANRVNWPRQWDVSPERLGRLERNLRVWLDGRLVWTTTLHNRFDPTDALVDVGSNPRGFSTSLPDYAESIRSMPFSTEERREFLLRNLAETR